MTTSTLLLIYLACWSPAPAHVIPLPDAVCTAAVEAVQKIVDPFVPEPVYTECRPNVEPLERETACGTGMDGH